MLEINNPIEHVEFVFEQEVHVRVEYCWPILSVDLMDLVSWLL